MNNSSVFDESYFARCYASYRKQNPRYKSAQILSLIKQYRERGNLLDIGCGLGLFLRAAKAEGYNVHGCDISAFAVSRCLDEIPTQCCSMADLPYENSCFDVVTVLDVIEHVSDLWKGIREVKRVARRDAIVVFLIPVYDGIVGRIVGRLDKDATHVNKLSRFRWIEVLKKEFDVMEWTGAFRYFFFKSIYLHFHSAVLRKWAPAIIVVGRNRI